jgi:dihydrofolate reductase
MGRKTYESIGNHFLTVPILLFQKKDWFEEGILIVGSIKEAVKFAKKLMKKFSSSEAENL